MQYIDEILNAIENSDFEGALQLIDEHRAQHKNDPEFLTVQAILCIHVHEYESALKILLDGVAQYHEDVDLLYNLGYVYQRLNDNKNALDFYQKAMMHSDDAALINEIEELCADIRALPEFAHSNFMPHVGSLQESAVVKTISQDELRLMDFDLEPGNYTPEKLRVLTRRMEFGFDTEQSVAALAEAIEAGWVNPKDIEHLL